MDLENTHIIHIVIIYIGQTIVDIGIRIKFHMFKMP